jgi:hypothetical protein
MSIFKKKKKTQPTNQTSPENKSSWQGYGVIGTLEAL